MKHPAYQIQGPAQICFSGGRTSGYMLHQILEANDGLPRYASYADLLREADFLVRQLELHGLEPPDPDHESTAPLVDCRCGD